jgi:hypothetical protein
VDAAPSPDPRNHRWIFTCAEDERLGCVSEDGSLQRHASCINLECVPKCMDPQILVNGVPLETAVALGVWCAPGPNLFSFACFLRDSEEEVGSCSVQAGRRRWWRLECSAREFGTDPLAMSRHVGPSLSLACLPAWLHSGTQESPTAAVGEREAAAIEPAPPMQPMLDLRGESLADEECGGGAPRRAPGPGPPHAEAEPPPLSNKTTIHHFHKSWLNEVPVAERLREHKQQGRPASQCSAQCAAMLSSTAPCQEAPPLSSATTHSTPMLIPPLTARQRWSSSQQPRRSSLTASVEDGEHKEREHLLQRCRAACCLASTDTALVSSSRISWLAWAWASNAHRCPTHTTEWAPTSAGAGFARCCTAHAARATKCHAPQLQLRNTGA